MIGNRRFCYFFSLRFASHLIGGLSLFSSFVGLKDYKIETERERDRR